MKTFSAFFSFFCLYIRVCKSEVYNNVIKSLVVHRVFLVYRKEIRKVTFKALALRRICSDEGLTLETSAFESLYGGQFTVNINPFHKTKLSCYTSHRRSTTVSLETYPSILSRTIDDFHFLIIWVFVNLAIWL